MAVGVADQQRGLPEVVEEQAGQHEPYQASGDRRASEVAHVGVERLAAGDDEEDAAEGEERLLRLGRRRSGRCGSG